MKWRKSIGGRLIITYAAISLLMLAVASFAMIMTNRGWDESVAKRAQQRNRVEAAYLMQDAAGDMQALTLQILLAEDPQMVETLYNEGSTSHEGDAAAEPDAHANEDEAAAEGDEHAHEDTHDHEGLEAIDARARTYANALIAGDPDLNIASPEDASSSADDATLMRGEAEAALAEFGHFSEAAMGAYAEHLADVSGDHADDDHGSEGHGDDHTAVMVELAEESANLNTEIGAMIDASKASLRATIDSTEKAMLTYNMISSGLLIAIPILAIMLGISMARRISRPLKEATQVMDRIGEGDIEGDLTLPYDDEISSALNVMNAKLAENMRQLKETLGNLRSVATTVVASAEGLAATSEQVMGATDRLREGADVQSSATEETSSSIEQMAASIDQVASNAETLGSNTEETSATISQMSASVEQIAANMDSLSSAVAESSASVQQMIASIDQVADRADSISSVADRAATASQDGKTAVEQMADAMVTITQAIESSSEVMSSLGQRSREIGEITAVIDDIAEQTNLLALNAAIEAARAGEHGRGFAVVAEAVRELAERSTNSTKEIANLIQTIKDDTDRAMTVTQAGAQEAAQSRAISEAAIGALEDVTSNFAEVLDSMKQIGVATREQVEGGRQVIQSVETMGQLQSQIRNATQEQARGSGQIVEAVEVMRNLVRQVVTATGEQKRGGEQMVTAMENISETTRDNLSSVNDLGLVAQNLTAQSEDLKKLVGEFDLAEADV